jgi:hypothetical protein
MNTFVLRKQVEEREMYYVHLKRGSMRQLWSFLDFYFFLSKPA